VLLAQLVINATFFLKNVYMNVINEIQEISANGCVVGCVVIESRVGSKRLSILCSTQNLPVI
jgi:hypothetical protein